MMGLCIGIVPLACLGFDMALARAIADKACASLEAAGFALVGERALLSDAAAARAAVAGLAAEKLDLMLVLQTTFTDARMVVDIAKAATAPLAIWAFPEKRTGGRLRLNSLSGVILGVHALGRAGMACMGHFGPPDADELAAIVPILARGERPDVGLAAPGPAGNHAAARALMVDLAGTRIGLIGEPPAGFDTSRCDAAALASLAGVEIVALPLAHLFQRARAQSLIPGLLDDWQERADALAGIDQFDHAQVRQSLALAAALEEIEQDNGLSALAVRCWPETFDGQGCAACAPMGFLSEDGTPCACEADVFGALTGMILNAVSEAPSWLADLVDIDAASDTAVFWRCGSAPLSMADEDEEPRAQIHAIRNMALLQEFALKPGRVTLARISQSGNVVRMVLAGGEMLRAPKSFAGTSGVVRFDRPAGEVLDAMLGEALEHRFGIAYGDHRPALRALAAEMGVAVVELA